MKRENIMLKTVTIFSIIFQFGVAKSGSWEINTDLVSYVPLFMISISTYPEYNKKGLRVIIGPLNIFISKQS